MRFIKWILIGIICVALLSCDDIVNPGDVSINISPSVDDFIWDSQITITVTATKIDDLDKIIFYIDGEQVKEDNVEPFDYIWNTATVTYERHEIEVVGHSTKKRRETK